MKSSCYENYAETEEKYYEAIECQKVAKVPYKVILGDQQINNGLEVEQQKNKDLEAHVTLTRKNSQEGWASGSRTKPILIQQPKQDSILSDQVIDKFMYDSVYKGNRELLGLAFQDLLKLRPDQAHPLGAGLKGMRASSTTS